jgi:signal transduction histidine kinase
VSEKWEHPPVGNLFIRVYLALSVCLLVILGLVYSSVVLLKTAHTRDYWEDHLGAPMVVLLHQQVSSIDDAIATLNASGIHVSEFDLDDLGQYEKYRLGAGKAIAITGERTLSLRMSIDGRGLEMRQSLNFYGIWKRFFTWVMRLDIDDRLPLDESLALVSGYLPFPVTPQVAQTVNHELDLVDNLILIEYQGTQLLLGPIPAAGFWSLVSTISVVLFSFVLLALVVFWLVSSVQASLKKLDQATVRLAQGHLTARVAVNGEDPASNLWLSFNKMAEHIQKLIQMQREMMRAVSHELRTPVARLRFGLQMVEDVSSENMVVRQVQDMDADIQELDQLVDEILTYSRLEEGGPLLEFQSHSISEVAEAVVREVQAVNKVDVIYVGLDQKVDDKVEMEVKYIHRALLNLVSNACKYAKSQVAVSCELSAASCRIDVQDDGPGVPEDQWAKVFQAFARLDDSRTRSTGGYGLGLSIVRRIAYWHGGRAMVSRSMQLGGAKFSLVWPRVQSE